MVDATVGSFVFELTGATEKIDAFVALMRPLGLAEVSRSGVAAIAAGRHALAGRCPAPAKAVASGTWYQGCRDDCPLPGNGSAP